MLIRDAVTDDLPGILAIHNDAIANSLAIWTEEQVDLGERAAWLTSHERDGYPVLVVVDDTPQGGSGEGGCGGGEIGTGGSVSTGNGGASGSGSGVTAGDVSGTGARGGVLGYASLSNWRTKTGYRHTVEDSIYLRTDATGRGLGRLLLGALLERARELGYHVVIADIEAGNAASIRLHESFGFEVCTTLREVGTKHGRWLDLTTMRLQLD